MSVASFSLGDVHHVVAAAKELVAVHDLGEAVGHHLVRADQEETEPFDQVVLASEVQHWSRISLIRSSCISEVLIRPIRLIY